MDEDESLCGFVAGRRDTVDELREDDSLSTASGQRNPQSSVSLAQVFQYGLYAFLLIVPKTYTRLGLRCVLQARGGSWEMWSWKPTRKADKRPVLSR